MRKGMKLLKLAQLGYGVRFIKVPCYSTHAHLLCKETQSPEQLG